MRLRNGRTIYLIPILFVVSTVFGGVQTVDEPKAMGDVSSRPVASSVMQLPAPELASNTPESIALQPIEGLSHSLTDVAYVATALDSVVEVTDNPRSAVRTASFANPTQFGGPRVFLVTDNSHPTHVEVSLPLKPNGQRGWVERSAVELSAVEHKAVVDRDNNRLVVWREDEIIVDTTVVVGTEFTPTPLGVFYVRDIIPQNNPNGDYGPHILALSGFSEVLDTFAGGLPAIAIHGTNRPEHLGEDRSNGCVRVHNDLIELLAETVPLGTPVEII